MWDLARAEGTLEGLRAQLTQAQQDAVDAEQRGQEAEREADRQIAQAEQQANVSQRVGPLHMALSAEDPNGEHRRKRPSHIHERAA